MIELAQVSLRSGPFELKGLNLSIPSHAYAVLMGGTGQGKTTILEAICGLRSVTAGRVLLDGRDVTRLKPADRLIGYVPQDLALFPTMTVREHLEFALRVRRHSSLAINQRVEEVAHGLSIEPLLGRKIRHLSGGEAQRVALGRALSFRPRVLILDEPLNALDEATRDRLCLLLRELQGQSGLTTLHVTHSRVEAQALASKLYYLAGGQLIEQSLTQLSATESPNPLVGSAPS